MSGVLTSVVPSKSSYDDEEGSSPKLVKGVKDVMSRLPTVTISAIIVNLISHSGQHPKCERSYTRESVIKYLVSKRADVNVKVTRLPLPLRYRY